MAAWQGLVVAGMIASASENVLDKSAMTAVAVPDPVFASFIRVALYDIAAILAGMTGLLGPFHMIWDWRVLMLAPMAALTASAYTYLLETVDTSLIGAAGYVAPLAFLLIDQLWSGEVLTAAQSGAIVLLCLGGAAFAFDPRRLSLRAGITWKSALALLWGGSFTGCEAYLFRHLHAAAGIDPLGFFATLWSLAAVILLGVVMVRRTRHGRRTNLAWLAPFCRRTAASKIMDMVSSACFGFALTLATVSQVSSMDAAYPLILLLATAAMQSAFGMRLDADMGGKSIAWKAAAASLLAAGAGMVG